MSRRKFIKNSALGAIVISTTGFVRFDGHHYVGDCETTTDILGPFYRPNSPMRKNLAVPGAIGDPIELGGVVYNQDCVTPYKNAKVELWHCSAEGVYDNTSDEFLYRGTVLTDANGKYTFNTILPVPYDIGGGNYRPAHFHMMITADGYIPLVTQLYFTGDPHLTKDSSSSAPQAVRRILDIQNRLDGSKKVEYNVGLSKKLPADPAALDKLIGEYVDSKDPNNKIEFFKNNDMLWLKNEVFGLNLDYQGKNTFVLGGISEDSGVRFVFEFLSGGSVIVASSYVDSNGEKHEDTFVRKS